MKEKIKKIFKAKKDIIIIISAFIIDSIILIYFFGGTMVNLFMQMKKWEQSHQRESLVYIIITSDKDISLKYQEHDVILSLDRNKNVKIRHDPSCGLCKAGQ